MYWSVDEVDSTPHFSHTMPRNRFQLIWRFLHFNDNASQDAADRLYKVRPVLDYVLDKFKELYQPGQNICIDEGMMQWRGRLSFRVYNPQKPVKYGIKSYILCDSATGYCFNMQPYVGRPNTLQDTIFSLLDRLPGHGYMLYMDNFYNSVALCERLLGAQTNVCGTLRKNRGEPKTITDLAKTDLGVGEKVVLHNKKVMVVAWQDKRLVKMVTTCHRDSMKRVEVWQKGHKEKVPLFKPECVVAYNLSMNGVDKLDQNITYYPFIRRSLNWSKKFVAYILQLCMFNAYIIYKHRNQGECKSLLTFIRRVVQSWTTKRVGEKEKGDEREVGEQVEEAGVGAEGDGRSTPRAPYKTDPESRLDGKMANHHLEPLMPTSNKARPARRCRVCVRRGLRSETRLFCKSCGVPLHAGECFTAFHTQRHYADG
ncbi:piggyBac transposable element-derived protein 4-like [Thalassophryne amazonica]|nr:piggyBac transposable element-derived protein 4-like [Thalassophryne amazonica]